jgi:hypothetical protein
MTERETPPISAPRRTLPGPPHTTPGPVTARDAHAHAAIAKRRAPSQPASGARRAAARRRDHNIHNIMPRSSSLLVVVVVLWLPAVGSWQLPPSHPLQCARPTVRVRAAASPLLSESDESVSLDLLIGQLRASVSQPADPPQLREPCRFRGRTHTAFRTARRLPTSCPRCSLTT